MEAKLKVYRALRRRQEMIDNIKDQLEKSKENIVGFLVPKIFTDMGNENEEKVTLLENEEPPPINPTLLLQPEDPNETASEVSELDDDKTSLPYLFLKWSIYGSIWLFLFIYFLYIQFAAVFFIISLFIGIYYNTRTRPKKKGEVSAYSVFNENCASIDGTLKAEQLQREMMFGAAGVRMF